MYCLIILLYLAESTLDVHNQLFSGIGDSLVIEPYNVVIISNNNFKFLTTLLSETAPLNPSSSKQERLSVSSDGQSLVVGSNQSDCMLFQWDGQKYSLKQALATGGVVYGPSLDSLGLTVALPFPNGTVRILSRSSLMELFPATPVAEINVGSSLDFASCGPGGLRVAVSDLYNINKVYILTKGVAWNYNKNERTMGSIINSINVNKEGTLILIAMVDGLSLLNIDTWQVIYSSAIKHIHAIFSDSGFVAC